MQDPGEVTLQGCW